MPPNIKSDIDRHWDQACRENHAAAIILLWIDARTYEGSLRGERGPANLIVIQGKKPQ